MRCVETMVAVVLALTLAAGAKDAVRLEPAEAVVGVPCAFVFTFDGATKDGARVQVQRIEGLPDDGLDYLAEAVEPYADGTYRLPVRFREACTNTLHVKVSGMRITERGGGSFRMTSSASFRSTLPPLKLDVRPLPVDGRPEAFSGAVGTNFRLTQTLEPAQVHPGDLVTATYTLAYSGYLPSNAWPRVERLSKEFKAYEPKEMSRTATRVVWQQALVPRTVAATNSALVSLSYYNPHTRRYEVTRSNPKPLVFVSDRAASTQNTAVLMNAAETAAPAADAGAGEKPLVLRFAPADASPVVVTLPPGTPVTERARANGWRRLESARGIGWSR